MREPILPPPPPIHVAVRAALHVLWFRIARAFHRHLRAVQAVRLQPAGSRPCLLPDPEDDRSTRVEGRRVRA